MKKLFTIFFLCIIIAATFGYSGLKLMAVGSEDNYFNRQYRAGFAVYPPARAILGLHRDGDAKSDYIGDRYEAIRIEIDSMAGYKIPAEVLNELAQKISAVTGRPVSLMYSNNAVAYEPLISDSAVEDIYFGQRNYPAKNQTASLYVLLVSASAENPDLIGSTLDETGLIAYMDTLADFTKFNNDLFNVYLLSTLLHEFGHQIGLSHNAEDNCLMNEHADQRRTFFENASEVISDFCSVEIKQIESIKRTISL